MVDNISSLGDQSFFEVCPYTQEKPKRTNNITKNSSNAEGTYENLCSEINKITNNPNISDNNMSNTQHDTEPLIDTTIWKKDETEPQTDVKFTKTYASLKKDNEKKMSLQADNYRQSYVNRDMLNLSLDNDNDRIEEDDEYIRHKVSFIKINPTSFKHALSVNEEYIQNKCSTEPDDSGFVQQFTSENSLQDNTCVNQRIFQNRVSCNRYVHPMQSALMHSYNMSDSAQLNSFLSTQYSSNIVYPSNNLNSNDEIINFDGSSNENNVDTVLHNSHRNDYRVHISTNESVESNNSSRYNHNQSSEINASNKFSYNDKQMKRFSFTTLNEGHLNAFKKKPLVNQQGNNAVKRKPDIIKLKQEFSLGLKGEKQLLNLDNIACGKDKTTTVMIRNIPIKYTDDMLMTELASFDKKYDCLYMPYDFDNNGNKGYAFINFTHPFHILLFHQKFQNKAWELFESKKICELNLANFQGISKIQKHANNYKGQKKPTFYQGLSPLDKLEVPIRYLSRIKYQYPNMLYEEKGKLFVITSFR